MAKYYSKSRYGDISIEADNDVIIAEFKGGISEELVEYFITDSCSTRFV